MSKPTNEKKEQIVSKRYSIYSESDEIHDPEGSYYTKDEIESLISEKMVGYSFHGLPLRTRSKVAKQLVCEALGYPIPSSFKKTQPRFPAQNLDTYVQKSNNLQVWNEELDPSRRYLIIRLNDADEITKVKVVTGQDLALLDTTGTLTQKYQARLDRSEDVTELISDSDTDLFASIITENSEVDLKLIQPTDYPSGSDLFTINQLYERLKSLVGSSFKDIGADQERNRGAELHKLVCQQLGYSSYADNGQFPDVRNQLLEVKLQTSPTIDLGLVCPDSTLSLDMPLIKEVGLRHKDVRYALFYAEINEGMVMLTNFYLTTGEDFFSRFSQFQGKVLNKKLQIPLSKDFFD
ncbi:hypothetical protein [Ekhidna sp.]